MTNDKQRVRDVVFAALKDVLGKRAKGVAMDESTEPRKDLGMESLDGIPFACSLSERLGFEVPHDCNPLVDDERQRFRRVKEIIAFMQKLMREQEERNGKH